MPKYFSTAPVTVNISANRLAGPLTLEPGHEFTKEDGIFAAVATRDVIEHFGDHDATHRFAFVTSGQESIIECAAKPFLVEAVAFHFDIKNSEGRTAWDAFKAERKAEGLNMFGPVLADYATPGGLVALSSDPTNAHGNQWHSLNAGHVFDFYLQSDCAPHSHLSAARGIRRGYYLKLTEEALQLRRDFGKCGYCGTRHKMPATFCCKCLGSEYLKETDLHLTRVLPIADDKATRAKLTEAEAKPLMQAYRAAQANGNAAKAAAKRREVEEKCDALMQKAQEERDGFLWLIDNGHNVANVIYYSHSRKFCFGWRADGLSETVASDILEWISEFPFQYTIKRAGKPDLNG